MLFEMKKLDGNQKLLLSLMAAVALLGVAAYKSVFGIRESKGFRASIQLNGAKGINSNGRAPASVGERLQNFEGVSSTVTVSCRNLVDLQNVEAGSVRLKSFDCGEKNDFHVVNKSNGYESSVFKLEDKSLSTDFINLSEGPNQVEITFKSGSQKVTKQIVINRFVASSTESE